MESRYFINKLGIVNFWYYDIEEFELSNGKLLLRGSNGSGKSVTMQSFLPLLLDGNKSPERLDPFGSKARTIANYLLDEDTNEKTAYLYMEFNKGGTENYITIGMGLKAVKNKPVQSWYFILSDGRRIGKDLFLYKDAGGLIPLTKKQLENEMGTANFYTESQKKYMENVNKYLFGFDEIEAYEELLNLVISIRSPKLSKDFKPTEIYKILTDSLKVLSDEDLRAISDSMENMDSLKDSLDENRRSYKAATNIKYHYDKYNIAILLEKARELIKAHNSFTDATKIKDKKIKNYKQFKEEIDSINIKLSKKENESKIAEEKYEKLINREEYKNKKELEEIKIRRNDNINSKKQKESSLEKKKAKSRDYQRGIKEEKDSMEVSLKKLENSILELEDLAEEISFQECMGISKEKLQDLTVDILNEYGKSINRFEAKLREAEANFKEYKIQKDKLTELSKEVDSLEKNYNEEKINMKRVEELFITEKDSYKVSINSSLKENNLYILNEDEKLKVFKAVDEINDYVHIQECYNLLQGFLNEKINGRNSYITLENTLIKDYEEEINGIRKDIQELKNNKEIEPPRTEGTIKNRERLKAQGVDFIPMYKAVDFLNGFNDDVIGYIEASLINMGLLDALIINPKDKEIAMKFEDGMEDKYIFSNPNLMSFNLTNILSVDKEQRSTNIYGEIDNVLQSIFLEDIGSTYLDEKGFYRIGILGGKSIDKYIHKYIGEASRKRYRQELIKEKEVLIEDIERKISKHKKSLDILNLEIEMLNKEYSKLPILDNIKEAIKMISEIETILKNLDNDIIKIKNKEFAENQKLKDIKLKIIDKIKGFEELNSLKLIQDALDAIHDYRDILTDSKINLNTFKNSFKLIQSKEENLEGVFKDIDDIYYDINSLSKKINEDEIKILTIEEALSKVDLSQIEEEIDYCLKIKRENPSIIKALSNDLGAKRNKVDALEEVIDALVKEIELKERELDIYKLIFNEEYSLQYVNEKEDGDIVKNCKDIIEGLSSDNEKNREFYSNKITESINKNSADLREYVLKELTLFNDNEIECSNKWLRQRRDFKWKIQGKDVNLLVLIYEIKHSIDELELLISEEERKIFEEVLMNTISQKIQAKIYQSNNWVKKINELMNSMDTSSSLKLNLSWVPKKSDTEGQIDISKLVEILQRGDRNKESDLKNLAKHFSEKVKEELRKYEGSGEARNYHSIIKDVLDYRKWYEFKLHYVKNNERKKELTNNAFFQFSGGEKAMAMYIPLFSAIYARYEKGRGDCPRIISMDEAFAGVDENNIRDMFRLLKELDLDYILNSQILWGDYDTVENLAICELIREENDDVVSVLKYLWNGKEKVLANE